MKRKYGKITLNFTLLLFSLFLSFPFHSLSLSFPPAHSLSSRLVSSPLSLQRGSAGHGQTAAVPGRAGERWRQQVASRRARSRRGARPDGGGCGRATARLCLPRPRASRSRRGSAQGGARRPWTSSSSRGQRREGCGGRGSLPPDPAIPSIHLQIQKAYSDPTRVSLTSQRRSKEGSSLFSSTDLCFFSSFTASPDHLAAVVGHDAAAAARRRPALGDGRLRLLLPHGRRFPSRSKIPSP